MFSRDFKKLNIEKYLDEETKGGEAVPSEKKGAKEQNAEISRSAKRRRESTEQVQSTQKIWSFLAEEIKLGNFKLKVWELIFLSLLLLIFMGIGIAIGRLIGPRTIVLAVEKSKTQIPFEKYEGSINFGYTPVLLEYPLNAKGMIVVDRINGSKLAYWHENDQLPIASLTKLVTAYVALQYWKEDEYLSVTHEVDPNVESSARLKNGERYKVRDLVAALLISSANEAGYTLADNYPGGVKSFVEEMNYWVFNLGLQKTNFVDPVGIGKENVSTPSELTMITRVVLENKTISSLVGTRVMEIHSLEGRKTQLTSTNQLLKDENFYGVKTGMTTDAGPCLIEWYKDGSNDMIIVLLNVSKRFDTAKKLAETLRK